MIDRIKKALGIAAGIAFVGAFTIGLACWTLWSWRDVPLLNFAFWIAPGFVAYCAWRENSDAKVRGKLKG